MPVSRKIPGSNIGREEALVKMQTKKNSVAPADSVFSADISKRIDDTTKSYTDARANVIAMEQIQRKASADAIVGRGILGSYIGAYFKSMNIAIDINKMILADRAYYGLDTSNQRLPNINGDANLIHWGNQVVKGDNKRVDAGGLVITLPLIADFIAINDDTQRRLKIFSNAKSNVNKAQDVVNALNPDADKLILRSWNEIETFFSELEPSAKRAAAREWGVKYVSTGAPGIVTGKCIDATTGAPLAGVTVHLEGVGHKVVSGADGTFTLNTNLYGDLTLIAKLKNYADANVSFMADEGSTSTLVVKMTAVL